ncbi:MAG: phosphatase PAP2 family protein [Chloroflexi bacterium]|nr:phosphatase PAP2 family protein [Chloroflexota bacterium]MCI0580402.1 phosphatase PAP2 family protein [Chloroflexota bacterium]MCI0650173.1 phosphatase PAP2 family protein [Chloroflexota bacterium]MCI0729516.1 phosphatase PAP2 family protein [Chloroflexota bacterium]
MVVETATLIGTHALELLVLLIGAVLAGVYALGHLFERYQERVWQVAGRGWRWLMASRPARRLRERHGPLLDRAGQWLRPWTYLWLHLTAGLVVTLVMVAIFGELAGEVMEGKEIARFDYALAQAIYDAARPQAVGFFRLLTHAGGGYVLTAIAVSVGAYLLWRRCWYLLIGWVVALGGGVILSMALKEIFQRERPAFSEPFALATGFSFPSGHAMGAVIVYGMLTYVLVRLLDRFVEKIVLVVLVTLILLIGFSRMYLGVHYFSDVVAGYVVGTAWLALTISGVEIARRHRHP